MCPQAIGAPIRARAKERFETSHASVLAIAVETGVAQCTIDRWARVEGWRRPSLPKPTPPSKAKRMAAGRKLYEGGGTIADIAFLVGTSLRTLTRRAKIEGWRRRHPNPFGEGGGATAAITAALSDPNLDRAALLRIYDQEVVRAGVEMLKGRRNADKRIQALGRLKPLIKEGLAATGAPKAGTIDASDQPATFEEINRLVERIARRFEGFEGEGKPEG